MAKWSMLLPLMGDRENSCNTNVPLATCMRRVEVHNQTNNFNNVGTIPGLAFLNGSPSWEK